MRSSRFLSSYLIASHQMRIFLLVGGLILTIYANRTHSLTQLAKLFGVDRNMVYRWIEKFEQLSDLFQKAKLRRKEKYSENVTGAGHDLS